MSAGLHRNFAVLAASNLLAPIFSMALVLAIARLLGVEALGKYSLMMTVYVLGQSCAALGLPVLVTRDVARRREDAGRYLATACALTVAIVLPVVACTVAMVLTFGVDPELAWALAVVLTALLPSIFTLHGEAVLLAFERAKDFVAIGICENALRAVLALGLVLAGHGVLAIAVLTLGVRTLAAAAFAIVLRRRGVDLGAGVDRRLARELLGEIPVVGAIPVVNAVYARADVFALSTFGTWAELGLYSAAARLVDLARTIPPAYGKALYPVLSRLYERAASDYEDVARRAIRDVLLLVVPMALLLCGLASPLIRLLYGPDLAAAADSLRVLAWALVPVGLATALAQVLFSARLQHVDLRVNLIATAVAVAANAALVPRWGAPGAAAATLGAATLYAALQYAWVRSGVLDPALGQYGARLFAVGAASCALTLWLGRGSALLGGVAGAALYLGGLAVTGIVTRHDLRRVRLYLASAAAEAR